LENHHFLKNDTFYGFGTILYGGKYAVLMGGDDGEACDSILVFDTETRRCLNNLNIKLPHRLYGLSCVMPTNSDFVHILGGTDENLNSTNYHFKIKVWCFNQRHEEALKWVLSKYDLHVLLSMVVSYIPSVSFG